QKAKALKECAKAAQSRLVAAAAKARLCANTSVIVGAKATIVLVGGTAPAIRGIRRLEQALGPADRTSAAALLAGDDGATVRAVATAVEASSGKPLIIDGASVLARRRATRGERASRAVLAATLQLQPGLVLVHVGGAIGPG